MHKLSRFVGLVGEILRAIDNYGHSEPRLDLGGMAELKKNFVRIAHWLDSNFASVVHWAFWFGDMADKLFRWPWTCKHWISLLTPWTLWFGRYGRKGISYLSLTLNLYTLNFASCTFPQPFGLAVTEDHAFHVCCAPSCWSVASGVFGHYILHLWFRLNAIGVGLYTQNGYRCVGVYWPFWLGTASSHPSRISSLIEYTNIIKKTTA